VNGGPGEMTVVKQLSTSSDSQCEPSVKSWVASVGAIAMSKIPGAKSKASKTKRSRTEYRFFDDAVWFK
jgi:hypothetical protein